MCDYKPYNNEKPSLKQHHDKTFQRIIGSKILKDGTLSYTLTNLCKAELMRTELLIQAHEKQLAQCVKQLCNMDLNIYISTTKALSFHVCIHLRHITTQEQSNTVKCLHPGSDIMEHLEEHVYDEIYSYTGHSP